MSYANTSDVVAELGRPAASDAESTQWEAWLERVERSIRRRFIRSGYDLDAQVDVDAPTADDVVDAEVAAVIRKIQNPNWGETSYTQSIDDASVTRRREGGDGGDPLALTDAEWGALLPVAPKRSSVFSVMPS